MGSLKDKINFNVKPSTFKGEGFSITNSGSNIFVSNRENIRLKFRMNKLQSVEHYPEGNLILFAVHDGEILIYKRNKKNIMKFLLN